MVKLQGYRQPDRYAYQKIGACGYTALARTRREGPRGGRRARSDRSVSRTALVPKEAARGAAAAKKFADFGLVKSARYCGEDLVARR